MKHTNKKTTNASMNKYLFFFGIALVLTIVSCSKKKDCHCSVPNNDMTHVFTIKGDCAGVNVIDYWDANNNPRHDSVFCVEYND